jgi:hypothetical protein
MTPLTIDAKLRLCSILTGLKAYRPRKKLAKRRFKDKRKRIVIKLKATP